MGPNERLKKGGGVKLGAGEARERVSLVCARSWVQSLVSTIYGWGEKKGGGTKIYPLRYAL